MQDFFHCLRCEIIHKSELTFGRSTEDTGADCHSPRGRATVVFCQSERPGVDKSPTAAALFA